MEEDWGHKKDKELFIRILAFFPQNSEKKFWIPRQIVKILRKKKQDSEKKAWKFWGKI